MSINVQLPKFEGPLGLLLYLIRKEEMDIMDIKIHEITKQYFEYIKLMKELDLEVAGEFVAMASTLIQIKSRMLLPQYDENGEVIETEDPRKELVQKLLEYQKYQEAAKLLYERPLVGRDVWLRGTRESLTEKEEEIVLEENALFALIASYRKALRSVKKKVHQVTAKAQSIASRVLEIKDLLIPGKRVTMMDLVTATEERARQALITFLSLLELGKMGFVGLYQSETYGDIWVDSKKPIETDVLARVEEYDSMRADQVAEKMMADAQKIDLEAELAETEAETSEPNIAEAPLDPQMGFDLESLNQEIADMASDEEILAAEAADGISEAPLMADIATDFTLDESSEMSGQTTEVTFAEEAISEDVIAEIPAEEAMIAESLEASEMTEEVASEEASFASATEETVVTEQAETSIEASEAVFVEEAETVVEATLSGVEFTEVSLEEETPRPAAPIEFNKDDVTEV
ncbi:MAG TPA: segregation/condensation protein A [Bdellovibrio sp.]|uniref:segregation and condensation protein A n=1 Tax=Bdellovibrio sp. TaxID=28201 RepID=UPI002EF68893